MENKDISKEEIEIQKALEFLGCFEPLLDYEYLGGISNNNYLINNQYVLRVPYRNLEPDSEFSYEMEELAFKSGIGARLINKDITTRFKLSEYLKNSQSISFDKYDDNMLNSLVEGISCIHNFKPHTYRYLDYYGDIKKRLNKSLEVTKFIPEKDYVSFLDIFRPKYEKLMKNICPSHIDLVNSNVLFDGKVKFIDFEYAAYTFPDFDLVSLLSENDIIKETKERIIEHFYPLKSEREEFKRNYAILQKALDFYWLLWSLDMISGNKQKDKIFLTIAKMKATRFNHS